MSLAASKVSVPFSFTGRTVATRPACRVCGCRNSRLAVKASAAHNEKQVVTASVGAATAISTLLASGNANAAMEISQLAAGDNRVGAVVALLLPAVGWVLFNIAGPALNQLNAMSEKSKGSAVAAGIGLTAASLAVASHAEAAQEVGQLSAGDNRLGAVLALLLPAIGWVLFNIAGPALNQLNAMSEKSKTKAIAVGLGLSAASFGIAENANAAQEAAQLAAGDNRLGAVLALLLPAIGWVLFNIAGPALNQLNSMTEKTKAKAAAAGIGLSAASLGIAQTADAAQEVAQLAAGDNRLSAVLALLLPAVGWVLFNIAGPALNQLNSMTEKSKGAKALVAGAGVSAAALGLAGSADAAAEISQIAASDNRLGAVLALLLPAVGWVLFNITGPALNQLNDMNEKQKK
eukprot:CAMPEP_0177607874 /NCGR_PEP_ID=MMETSP0419_2-20121207/18158_1 /TAXON_ID=582737 /ORGANISM="Tetraselmis sp., Strain GSL018" /LENGTH=404 /DNA_ID=CAMNT_0019102501 /DNA_START=121 /DNA_END=1335 /DNA_ORIENTATION=-